MTRIHKLNVKPPLGIFLVVAQGNHAFLRIGYGRVFKQIIFEIRSFEVSFTKFR